MKPNQEMNAVMSNHVEMENFELLQPFVGLLQYLFLIPNNLDNTTSLPARKHFPIFNFKLAKRNLSNTFLKLFEVFRKIFTATP